MPSPFNESNLADDVVDALFFRRKMGILTISAYVLMPDHLHAALSLTNQSNSLSDVLGHFKSYTTRLAWKYGVKGSLWQRNFYDHIVRRDEDLIAICEYILANPVRKGLVAEISQWPYAGMPDPLPIGRLSLLNSR